MDNIVVRQFKHICQVQYDHIYNLHILSHNQIQFHQPLQQQQSFKNLQQNLHGITKLGIRLQICNGIIDNIIMLTQQSAKTLGYKQTFNHKITNPQYITLGELWHKNKTNYPIPNSMLAKKHLYSYSKIGKTFGFETKRYIEYHDGILLYFQGENDAEYKGYCYTQNLYMYYIPLGTGQNLLHLTNGTEWSQFYFNDHTFFNQISNKLRKDVIQLNFYEKYSLMELLGKGTYSKVYLAKNKATEEKFAVKIVNKKDKNGSDTKNIVDQQKKIFGVLNSQYVCRMEQFFQQDDAYIFVLQYLAGRDLMTIFKDKIQIPTKDLIQIFKKILLGLAHIHQKKVIHRDLKPQNIMIDPVTLSPKLIDFGLSLMFGPKTDKKRYKRCGTMGYMAYEVIHNTLDKKKVYDCKCDIFSFGIIVHMMLMGYNPLKGKSYNETVQKNQQCKILFEKEEIIGRYGLEGLRFMQGLLEVDATKRLSAQEALHCEFIQNQWKEKGKEDNLVKNHIEETTQQKQDQAQFQFQYQDEQVTIPKFQNFVPKKINLQNRI